MSIALVCDGRDCETVGPTAPMSPVVAEDRAMAAGWGFGRITRNEDGWHVQEHIVLCPDCLPTNGGWPA